MASDKKTRRLRKPKAKKQQVGNGGETHQQAKRREDALTTDQGVPIADNQSSLKAGPRGPSLLEDFILREKITHFDHERIPERVVHARGYGAHGFFQAYPAAKKLSKAAFLQDSDAKTPVFVRFSTVAGSKGSPDLARDVRGFAVKFYTDDGIFDLVGNNIPVFFIQDAIKFPDLIHSVKPERDRGFPQAQSAHDTFWDFVGLTPESLHMLMWAMSDRAIPRSFRMMDGFGVHTFRFIDKKGKSTFVKFHWRAMLGSQAVMWDEALKINGADPDFHRKDLWNAIENGDYPEWELSVQAFDEEQADAFDFDILDASKLIPEELVPLTPIGKMTLDRNVDEFFAETEQVAFCPSHLVPGIDFTNDPLLQGRLFSYLDTQLSRLGGPNFHQIPINAPKCPVHNFHRGGHMQMHVPKRGRVSYDPNSLPDAVKAEHPSGFTSYPEAMEGDKRRLRPESFGDHYSQARLFWKSMTEPEQRHIVNAFAFELGNCEAEHIRRRMLGHLVHVDESLAERVADALGMEGKAETIEPTVPPRDPDPSPALSMVANLPETLQGRKLAVLVADGSDPALVDALRRRGKKEGANVVVVAPKIGGAKGKGGKKIGADASLGAAPSVLFDAVVVALVGHGAESIAKEADAKDFLSDAYRHCKIIGRVEGSDPLFEAAGVPIDADEGLVKVAERKLKPFFEAAKRHRIWERETEVTSAG